MVASHSVDAGVSISDQSLRALDATNFFVGGILAGLGRSRRSFSEIKAGLQKNAPGSFCGSGDS
jgi:hypothetical protein